MPLERIGRGGAIHRGRLRGVGDQAGRTGVGKSLQLLEKRNGCCGSHAGCNTARDTRGARNGNDVNRAFFTIYAIIKNDIYIGFDAYETY